MGAKCHRGVDDAVFQSTDESHLARFNWQSTKVEPQFANVLRGQLEETRSLWTPRKDGELTAHRGDDNDQRSWPSTAQLAVLKGGSSLQEAFSSPRAAFSTPMSSPRRPARSSPRPNQEVVLNIYNVGTWHTQALNRFLRPLGTGIFHCGVEVYGVEWSYSDTTTGLGDGIFDSKPRLCEGHSYYDSVHMGTTNASETDVLDLICMLQNEWPVNAYDTLSKNCCHFSNELCLRLGVGSIPMWVMSLAGLGASIMASGDPTCCRQVAYQAGTLCCASNMAGDTDSVEIVDIIEQKPVLNSTSSGKDPSDKQQLQQNYMQSRPQARLQVLGRELTN